MESEKAVKKNKNTSRRRRPRESVPTLCAIKKEKKCFLRARHSFNEEVIQGAFSGGGDGGGYVVEIDVSNLG